MLNTSLTEAGFNLMKLIISFCISGLLNNNLNLHTSIRGKTYVLTLWPALKVSFIQKQADKHVGIL